MCLILCAHQPSPEIALLVAANRDEFYARPARAAGFWREAPDLLAGRDEQAGGTWLGVTKGGRFAAVTNFREGAAGDPLASAPAGDEQAAGAQAGDAIGEAATPSRGELPTDFLLGDLSAEDYLSSLVPRAQAYRGFNLLLWDRGGFWHYGNRCGKAARLAPGYQGLSNQGLNCNWPKVAEGKERLEALVKRHGEGTGLSDAVFALLMDEGDGREHSNSFIRSEGYGTRAATLVIIGAGGKAQFTERRFAAGGKPRGASRFDFTMRGMPLGDAPMNT